jgi:hypothetical protein
MHGLGRLGQFVRPLLATACVMVAASTARAAPRPLVVELFTSQGCSSCPPADEIVAGLARTRPDILALTFHVTYWNDLGWQDPFSLAAATDRQRRYVALSVSPEVYTPALVIDGRRDVVGSDAAAVQAALVQGRSEMAKAVDVTVSRSGGTLGITVGEGSGEGSVVLVGYDAEHRTHVGRGENSGRTLLEANIVRSVTVAGAWSGRELHLRMAPPAGEQVAVLLQAGDGRILGAAP